MRRPEWFSFLLLTMALTLPAASGAGETPKLPESLVTIWTQQGQVTPSDSFTNDGFGWAVAVDGNTAIVSAIPFLLQIDLPGSAYIFTRNGVTWSQQAKLTVQDGIPSDLFGYSVSISGNTAVVGAPIAAVGGNLNQGVVYVFANQGGVWTQTKKLTEANGLPADHFGYSVSLTGDTLLVGAVTAGKAFVFTKSGTTRSQTAELVSQTSGIGFYGLSRSAAAWLPSERPPTPPRG